MIENYELIQDMTIKKLEINNNSYTGQLVNNQKNGIGIFEWKQYTTSLNHNYFGLFKSGKRNGFGKYSFNDNKYYIGFILHNYFDGFGMIVENGEIVNFGLYQNDIMVTDLLKYVTLSQLEINLKIFDNFIQQIENYFQTTQNTKQSSLSETHQLKNKKQYIFKQLKDLEIQLWNSFPNQQIFFKLQQHFNLIKPRRESFDIDQYFGQFKGRKPFGIGKYTWINNNFFIGFWNNTRNGFGQTTFANQTKHIGFWSYDQRKSYSFEIDQYNKIYKFGLYKNDNIAQLEYKLTSQHQQELLGMFNQFYTKIEDYLYNLNMKCIDVEKAEHYNNVSQFQQLVDLLEQEYNSLNSEKFQSIVEDYFDRNKIPVHQNYKGAKPVKAQIQKQSCGLQCCKKQTTKQNEKCFDPKVMQQRYNEKLL